MNVTRTLATLVVCGALTACGGATSPEVTPTPDQPTATVTVQPRVSPEVLTFLDTADALREKTAHVMDTMARFQPLVREAYLSGLNDDVARGERMVAEQNAIFRDLRQDRRELHLLVNRYNTLAALIRAEAQ